ncbi:hypothetical protein TRFO_38484 [Tritrichomonas foetus]|uniref:Tc1-like transposase DDE domain-containing protein n=1 Tax=Tritrichomonas foetus TaxID=1144522 RepID=A0A1J4J8I3_9EUKA|nr:hypothetical protein TRFO_38484 [Tritrichomonas foetus]|eukprot:OHS95448.1 hypothetical protein TRFO_38484 [Tritrichomonas foetus]
MQLYHDFHQEYPHVQISNEYFRKVMRKLTKRRTIQTGAADCRLSDIPSVLTDRIIHKICYRNCYSIDEKPFNIKKLHVNSAVVPNNYKGQIYNPIHKLKNLRPVYLIACNSFHSIVLLVLSNEPYNICSLNGLISALVDMFPSHSPNVFFLIDNAKFHQVDDENKELTSLKNISISYTAPSTCFFDPIFFYCTTQVHFIIS